MRIVLFILAVLSVSFAHAQQVATATDTASLQQPGQVERPDIKAGDSWTYSYHDANYGRQESAYTIKTDRVDGDRILVSWVNAQVGTSGTFFYNLDVNLLGQSTDQPNLGWPNFHFPLAVGQVWHAKYHSYGPGTRDYDNILTTTVASIEDVTVPAGTYKAFKIVVVRDYAGTNNGSRVRGSVEETYWYSPEVKSYVKRVVIDRGVGPNPLTRELLAYHVN